MSDLQSRQPLDASPNASILVSEDRARFRRRVKRLSVMVVLFVVGAHFLVGLGAALWVVARYLAKPEAKFIAAKQVAIKPEDRKHRMLMDEVASLQSRPVLNNRIQSLKPSKLMLPDMPKVPVDAFVPVNATAVASAQAGAGTASMASGAGNGGGFFGGAGSPSSGLLEGTLYDLKQTANRQPADMTTSKYLAVVEQVARSSNSESVLSRYFAAPTKLYLPQVTIPVSDANNAPKAFKVGDVVKPKYWLADYKGRFIAPETGRFRFSGFADDIILVRVDKRLVFDGSLLGGSKESGGRIVYLGDQSRIPARQSRKTGAAFSVKKGEFHDMEVIIGECPGGFFCAWLQIQKVGEDKPYWFRMTSAKAGLPEQHFQPEIRPLSDANGPVWLPAPMAGKFPGFGR